MALRIGSLLPPRAVARLQSVWNAALAEWATVLRRTDTVTAGSGRQGVWASPQPAGVHAAVADAGSPQTISTGLTQPTIPSVLTATVSGTLANVTPVSVVVTGTDKTGAVQTETLPAFARPGVGQICTVIGVQAFASITSYVQPACGAGVSIALGLATPARRYKERFRAAEAEQAGRLAGIEPQSVGLPAGTDVGQRDRVLFSGGALYEVRGSSEPRSVDYGLALDVEQVIG